MNCKFRVFSKARCMNPPTVWGLRWGNFGLTLDWVGFGFVLYHFELCRGSIPCGYYPLWFGAQHHAEIHRGIKKLVLFLLLSPLSPPFLLLFLAFLLLLPGASQPNQVLPPAYLLSSCCSLASLLVHLVFSSLSLALKLAAVRRLAFVFLISFRFRLDRLLLLLAFFFCLLPSLWLLQFSLIISCPWL